MRKYSNIVVIIEPKKQRQIALERAIEFVKYNPKITITALRVVYDYSYDMILINRKKANETTEDVIENHLENLNEMLKSFNPNDDIHIVPKVILAKDVGEGIIKELNESSYDLLIKGANNHGILDSIIFTPIDWYLLRNSPIPVIIAKEHTWFEGCNIVVAMDFSSSNKNQMININILREAQALATIIHGHIHIVNSAPIVLPTIMLEVPNYAPDVYAKSVIQEQEQRIRQFAKEHHIPEHNCHVCEGLPDDVIPRICKELDAKAVFIGTSGRQGVSAALIGNTCEEVVDYINADLFVINLKNIDESSK